MRTKCRRIFPLSCLVSSRTGAYAGTLGRRGANSPSLPKASQKNPLSAEPTIRGGKKCFSVDESMKQPTPTKKRRNKRRREMQTKINIPTDFWELQDLRARQERNDTPAAQMGNEMGGTISTLLIIISLLLSLHPLESLSL